MSNMYAIVLARYKMFPEVKTNGVSSLPPLVVFTSEDVSVFNKKIDKNGLTLRISAGPLFESERRPLAGSGHQQRGQSEN